MDIYSPSLFPGLLLCTSLALIFLFSFSILRKHKSLIRPNLPPGKTGWPIVGETPQLLLLGQKGHPEKFIHDRKNKHSSDVFRTSLFGDNMVFFCGPAANKFLFSNDNLVVTWWPKTLNQLVFSDTSTSIVGKIKPYRNLILGFLKMDAIKDYIPTMDSIAVRHIEKEWETKTGEVVVNELVKKYSTVVACQLLMGVKDHERLAGFPDRFAGVVAGILSVPINFPGTTFNKAIKDAKFLQKEIVVAIKEKKSTLEKEENPVVRDLLSYLLLTPDQNGKLMSEEDMSDRIMGLLIAGHDTTSSVLTLTIKYLAELPHIYQEVYKEVMEIANAKATEELLNWNDINKMKYTWNVVCEAMRLVPPAQIGFKEALADITFAGFTIPKGWKACWSAHSTHNDPAYFPNPNRFDPT
ncbi:hypothetical protein C3L33_18867, partial [Rhododendron williamsianum]